MFGCDSSTPMLPVLQEDSMLQCHVNAMPQLKLFGDVPIGCSHDTSNHMRNGNASAVNRSTKRGREAEPNSKNKKLHMPFNNHFPQEEILNPISTGLKLSYDEDEHNNSSVTTASKTITAVSPLIFSLFGNNLGSEIDRQKQELNHFLRLQEGNMIKLVGQLKQRHTLSLLRIVEKYLCTKLHEKDMELESVNLKNCQLVERIKQMGLESQSWECRAKYNESLISILRNNLQHVGCPEGYGDSEDVSSEGMLRCRVCRKEKASVLLWPCRHLCACERCGGFVDLCPVCNVQKTASVKVYLS